MSTKNNTVTVKILERDYQVACPEEQEAQLIMSAKYLDKQMRGIRDSGKVIGLERIAVMAALNTGYELLSATDGNSAQPGNESVKRINHKLDEALHDLRQLEIG